MTLPVATIQYILVWRRSPTSRYLDVQLSQDGGEIAVFTPDPDEGPLLSEIVSDEDTLIAYINSAETSITRVEAGLAHRVLGWTIP